MYISMHACMNVTANVLIDQSEAFNSLRHATLLNKNQLLGTSRNALNQYLSYLTNCEQTTRIGTSISSSLKVTLGVPQGSILEPLLFSFYMNDLSDIISKCSVESYVDDTNSLFPLQTAKKQIPYKVRLLAISMEYQSGVVPTDCSSIQIYKVHAFWCTSIDWETQRHHHHIPRQRSIPFAHLQRFRNYI